MYVVVKTESSTSGGCGLVSDGLSSTASSTAVLPITSFKMPDSSAIGVTVTKTVRVELEIKVDVDVGVVRSARYTFSHI